MARWHNTVQIPQSAVCECVSSSMTWLAIQRENYIYLNFTNTFVLKKKKSNLSSFLCISHGIAERESQFSNSDIENLAWKFDVNWIPRHFKVCPPPKMSGLDLMDRRLSDLKNLLWSARSDFLWEVGLHLWLRSEQHDPLSSKRTEIKASLYISLWKGHIIAVLSA